MKEMTGIEAIQFLTAIFWILNLTLSCHHCAQQTVEGNLTVVVSQQALSQHA